MRKITDFLSPSIKLKISITEMMFLCQMMKFFNLSSIFYSSEFERSGKGKNKMSSTYQLIPEVSDYLLFYFLNSLRCL